jgi:hypothetical protein
MRNVIIIEIAVLCVSITGSASGVITQEQAEKLISAICKPSPSIFDITLNLFLQDYTKNEKDLRERFENKYEKIYGSMTTNLVPDKESFIRDEITYFMKEQQQGGRKETYRIRFDANNLRTDISYDWACSQIKFPDANQNIDFNISFDSSIIETPDQNGHFNRYSYDYFIKSSSIEKPTARKSYNRREWIINLALVPPYITLKTKLGIPPTEGYKLNTAQFNQLCSGKLNGINIVIENDEFFPETRDKIKLSFYPENPKRPITKTVIVCDKNDYSRVYYCGISKLSLVESTWSDFDSQDYPHNITIMEYDTNVNLKKRVIYQVLDVNLNTPIPKKVFEFNPPKDYEIREFDPNGAKKIIRYKAGYEGGIEKFFKAEEENDVNALKELLGHEEGKIRALSLRSLGFLLAQKPDELKAAALTLKNDPNQTVREEAQQILTRIERLKSAEPNKK